MRLGQTFVKLTARSGQKRWNIDRPEKTVHREFEWRGMAFLVRRHSCSLLTIQGNSHKRLACSAHLDSDQVTGQQATKPAKKSPAVRLQLSVTENEVRRRFKMHVPVIWSFIWCQSQSLVNRPPVPHCILCYTQVLHQQEIIRKVTKGESLLSRYEGIYIRLLLLLSFGAKSDYWHILAVHEVVEVDGFFFKRKRRTPLGESDNVQASAKKLKPRQKAQSSDGAAGMSLQQEVASPNQVRTSSLCFMVPELIILATILFVMK